MKYSLTIIILCISTIIFGQTLQNKNLSLDAYKQIPEVSVIDSIDAMKLTGKIEMRWGLSGNRLFLDSNMSFRLISYDCLTDTLTDTGHWHISFNRMLALDSKKGRELFDIIKIRNQYYFVKPSGRQELMNRLNAYIQKNKNMYLVGVDLIQDYYTKNLN